MLIFDIFCGTKSATAAFADAGHEVVTFDWDKQFAPHYCADVMELDASELLARHGTPDFVWLSPPCTAFSVASIGRHWAQGETNPIPKTDAARLAMALVEKARHLAESLDPSHGFLIENPRGMLRKLPVVAGLSRRTVTYCQYGDSRMKPTDLWGFVPGWNPRPPCRNGATCHESAPRGAKTGTQGLAGARERGRVPYELGRELLMAIEDKK